MVLDFGDGVLGVDAEQCGKLLLPQTVLARIGSRAAFASGAFASIGPSGISAGGLKSFGKSNGYVCLSSAGGVVGRCGRRCGRDGIGS